MAKGENCFNQKNKCCDFPTGIGSAPHLWNVVNCLQSPAAVLATEKENIPFITGSVHRKTAVGFILVVVAWPSGRNNFKRLINATLGRGLRGQFFRPRSSAAFVAREKTSLMSKKQSNFLVFLTNPYKSQTSSSQIRASSPNPTDETLIRSWRLPNRVWN